MKIKLFFLFFLFASLYSKEFPQTFSQLSTPLYSSVKPFSSLKDEVDFSDEIEDFEKSSATLIEMGYEVDKLREKKLMVSYLKRVRKLQKKYENLLNKLQISIEKSIIDNDYNKLAMLTSYDFKKLNESQQEQESQQYFETDISESTYSSKSDIKSDKKVKIILSQNEDEIDVSFFNTNVYPITLKVSEKYENIKKISFRKKEFVVAANSQVTYATLKLLNGKSSYDYKYSWTMGSKDAKHNDEYIYSLPYAKGTSHKVSQGYNGGKTHKGDSAYSVDFSMRSGTKIYAARDGVVVKVKSDSKVGGYDKEFINSANFIRILHNDGTFATYHHLEYKGVVVVVGEEVSKGDHIAYSGNTGFSSGPHLHFAVFKTKDASYTQTIPIKLKSTKGIIIKPLKGHYYKAI